jgi:hypothetical protein
MFSYYCASSFRNELSRHLSNNQKNYFSRASPCSAIKRNGSIKNEFQRLCSLQISEFQRLCSLQSLVLQGRAGNSTAWRQTERQTSPISIASIKILSGELANDAKL